MTLRALLQKCARKPVSWRAYLPAGRHLAAIVNLRAAFSLTPAGRPDRLRRMMGDGADRRGQVRRPSAFLTPFRSFVSGPSFFAAEQMPEKVTG